MDHLAILRDHLNTGNLRTDAEERLGETVQSMTDDEIGDGTFTADEAKGSAEKFIVSSLPLVNVVFVEFALDDVTGYLEYSDSQGTTIVHIPDRLVFTLRRNLRADADARNAR